MLLLHGGTSDMSMEHAPVALQLYYVGSGYNIVYNYYNSILQSSTWLQRIKCIIIVIARVRS